jgi:L-amino acid N-acyltransferase YncA
MQNAEAQPISIESMAVADWEAVRAIYLEGIRTGNATFETSAPDWEAWDDGHLTRLPLRVACAGGRCGLGGVEPGVRPMRLYAGVAEASIYVAQRARGRGIGSKLLAALVEASEREGIWTLQAGIFPENLPSIAIFKNRGFRVVGTREKIGCMDGRWRDVLLLERRSRVRGT